MGAAHRQLREASEALDHAVDYPGWRQAAEAIDRLTGAADWQSEDACPYFDAADVRGTIARMAELRAQGAGLALADLLNEDLSRHLNGFATAALYETAIGGTKHIVTEFLDAAADALGWLARTEIPGVSAADKRVRFETAWRVFGHSALLLSGGATWGFTHLGVIKALFSHQVLPHILSGSSTGAMIAAGMCTRNDAELADLFDHPEQIALEGLVPVGLRKVWGTGAWLDPEALYRVLRHNIGDWTFADAFAHSGRALNISVSPTRTRQKPRLLCYLTSPDVWVARAALASSAVPVLFPPVVLEARNGAGQTVPWVPTERWIDGSLVGDLPKQRLGRLHNVNHFIVSQTNPHVLPFVRHHGKRGLRPALSGLASATLRTHGTYAADLARRATGQSTGPASLVADQAHALLSQDYRGDIDIHPRFHRTLVRKVVSNPSPDDLQAFIREGERAVWPRLAMIQNQTRIGRVFRACIEQMAASGAPASGGSTP